MKPSGPAIMQAVMTGLGIRPGTIPVMAGTTLGTIAAGAGMIPGTMTGTMAGTVPGMIPGITATAGIRAGMLHAITAGIQAVVSVAIMRTLSVRVRSVATVGRIWAIAGRALHRVTLTAVV